MKNGWNTGVSNSLESAISYNNIKTITRLGYTCTPLHFRDHDVAAFQRRIYPSNAHTSLSVVHFPYFISVCVFMDSGYIKQDELRRNLSSTKYDNPMIEMGDPNSILRTEYGKQLKNQTIL